MYKNITMRPEDILTRLRQAGLLDDSAWLATGLAGDGSDRLFFRLSNNTATSYLAVLPAAGQESRPTARAMAEAMAALKIGTHLFTKGVPVPAIHFSDRQTGLIVFEDLGDTLLHETISEPAIPTPKLEELYREAVALLFHMQIKGREGFDTNWCWDSRYYDRQLMLTRESGYFLQSFCRDYLGIETFPDTLQHDFELLAERCAKLDGRYFLHRDFQSRNLMLANGRLRVIDFQGGRLGPLGYDLASLLIDPYAGLDEQLQNSLLDYYLSLAKSQTPDRHDFLSGYHHLALQRNLQILGAFAFLDRQKKKAFFRNYLKPAALSLNEHLAKRQSADYPSLRQLAAACLRAL